MEKSNKEKFLEQRMNETLSWVICSKSDVYDFTDRTEFIISVYTSKYTNLHGKENTIYIIERHEIVFDETFADTRELTTYQIIVICDGKKIADLNPYNVPKELFNSFVHKALNNQMESNDELI